MSELEGDNNNQLLDIENSSSDEELVEEGPYFSFLITNKSGNQKRVVAVVSHSRKPLEEIASHNGKKIKHTRSGAPNWKMTMLIGEFESEEDSKKFSESWKTGTRGIRSKINRGLELAKEKELTVWYDQPKEK